MRQLLFRTVRGRLLILAIGVEALMLTVMVGNSLRLLHGAMTDQARWHAEQIAPVLNAALVAPLLQRDFVTVQAIITESKSTEGIDYVAVVDRTGKRVAVSGWRDDEPLPPATIRLRNMTLGAVARYDVVVPITQLGQPLGTLHFGLNLTPIIAAGENLFNQGLTIAAIELLLSAVILALIGYRLTRRLTNLTQVSLEVADGNLTPRSMPEGDDDLGRLGAAFNTMSQAITERVRELHASEQRFRDLSFVSSDWVWEVGSEGCYTYASGKTEQLLGYLPEEIIGRTPFDLMPEEEAIRVRCLFSAIMEKLEPFTDLENTCLHKDGSTVTVLTSGVPIFDAVGNLTGYRGVDKDITERVAAERLLRSREEMYSNIFYHIGIGISVISPTLEIRSLNPIMKNWFPQVDPGMSPICYVSFNTPPRTEPCDYCPTVKTFRDGLTHEAVTETPTPDGIRNYKVVSSPVFDASGAIVAAIEVVEDITDHVNFEQGLRDAKDAAEAANGAKSQFLANMSHEIRTPMNAIIGLGSLLRQTALDDVQQDFLTKMNLSARSLLRIINDILDVSRVEAGKLVLEEIVFSLAGCLEQAANSIAVQAHGKGLEFHVVSAPETPDLLRGDPFRLEQVLLNLLGNAVKFTEKGEVRLSVAPVEQADGNRIMLEFEISDTGIGLSAEQIAELFQPFTQADSSTTRRYGGAGLGLSICKPLVELMGGSMRVEGEPGKGCVFSFTAGFERVSPSVSLPHPAFAIEADLRCIRGARVLVVEDNLINLQIAKLLLAKAGLRVTTAVNGSEAVAVVAQAVEPFDAVLMDIQMPLMDGYEATRRIRERWSREELPIIAMTAHALPAERDKCLNAGMNDHLAKPFDDIDLHEKLTRWIRSRPDMADQDALPSTEGDATSESPHVPELPGLDVRAALARLNLPWASYRELVSRFGRDHRDDGALIRDRLDSGDLEAARITAHTLKGVAGNLAATKLYAAASTLEAALKAGRQEEAAQCLPELAAHLVEVLHAAAILKPERAGANDKAIPTAAPDQLPILLTRLSRMLDRRELRAQELFAQVRPLLAASEPARTEHLANVMEKLDYRQALKDLQDLAARFSITLKEE